MNGIDDACISIRSQLLMNNPLPSVEVACATIQQEENQRELLKNYKTDDISAIFSQSNTGQSEKFFICNVYHKKGHVGDKCCHKIGYPDRYNKNAKNPRVKFLSKLGSQWKWTGNIQVNTRMSNKVFQSSDRKGLDSSAVNLIAQQLEQLLKLLLNNNRLTDIDDELEEFSWMVSCFSATGKSSRWIMDSRASDHMSSSLTK